MSTKKTIHRGTNARTAELTVWAMLNKEEVQERVNKGEPLAAFAREQQVTVGVIKDAFGAAKIALRERPKREPKPVAPDDALAAVIAVLVRLCAANRIPCDELQPFLPPKDGDLL